MDKDFMEFLYDYANHLEGKGKDGMIIIDFVKALAVRMGYLEPDDILTEPEEPLSSTILLSEDELEEYIEHLEVSLQHKDRIINALLNQLEGR